MCSITMVRDVSNYRGEVVTIHSVSRAHLVKNVKMPSPAQHRLLHIAEFDMSKLKDYPEIEIYDFVEAKKLSTYTELTKVREMAGNFLV